MKTNWEARNDRIDRLRMVTQNRFVDRIERLEAKAEALIGELCREGRPVFYVVTASGKVREGSRVDLLAFLIRNKYVR